LLEVQVATAALVILRPSPHLKVVTGETVDQTPDKLVLVVAVEVLPLLVAVEAPANMRPLVEVEVTVQYLVLQAHRHITAVAALLGVSIMVRHQMLVMLGLAAER
jgi:hypothetical protein